MNGGGGVGIKNSQKLKHRNDKTTANFRFPGWFSLCHIGNTDHARRSFR